MTDLDSLSNYLSNNNLFFENWLHCSRDMYMDSKLDDHA